MAKRLIALSLILAIAVAPIIAVYGQGGGAVYGRKVNWTVHSNPTTDHDFATAVCERGDYVYIIGRAGWDYRIEKRRKVDGELVSVRSDRLKWPNDCLIVKDKLYIVGYSFPHDVDKVIDPRHLDTKWVILVLDLNLSVLKRVEHNPSGRIDEARTIDSDGKYIYIAGVDSLPGNWQWRVEKRRIDDLELVKHYTSNPSNELDDALGIGINPKTKHIWVVGSEWVGGNPTWRIEILDEDLRLVKAIRLNIRGSARAIAFDEEGNAYVAGMGTIVKFDKDGREVARHERGGERDDYVKVLYSGGLVYIAGGEKIGGYNRHVLYVFNKSLKLVGKLVLSEGISADAFFEHGRMAFDGKNIYVAGSDRLPRNFRWTMYSIDITPYLKPGHREPGDGHRGIRLLDYALLIAASIAAVLAITVLYFVRKRRKV